MLYLFDENGNLMDVDGKQIILDGIFFPKKERERWKKEREGIKKEGKGEKKEFSSLLFFCFVFHFLFPNLFQIPKQKVFPGNKAQLNHIMKSCNLNLKQ